MSSLVKSIMCTAVCLYFTGCVNNTKLIPERVFATSEWRVLDLPYTCVHPTSVNFELSEFRLFCSDSKGQPDDYGLRGSPTTGYSLVRTTTLATDRGVKWIGMSGEVVAASEAISANYSCRACSSLDVFDMRASRLITRHNSLHGGLFGTMFDVSPSGSNFAYVGCDPGASGARCKVFVIDVATGTARIVAESIYPNEDFSAVRFSHDGSMLVTKSSYRIGPKLSDGRLKLTIVNVSTASIRSVVLEALDASVDLHDGWRDLIWSAGDKYIAYRGSMDNIDDVAVLSVPDLKLRSVIPTVMGAQCRLLAWTEADEIVRSCMSMVGRNWQTRLSIESMPK